MGIEDLAKQTQGAAARPPVKKGYDDVVISDISDNSDPAKRAKSSSKPNSKKKNTRREAPSLQKDKKSTDSTQPTQDSKDKAANDAPRSGHAGVVPEGGGPKSQSIPAVEEQKPKEPVVAATQSTTAVPLKPGSDKKKRKKGCCTIG